LRDRGYKSVPSARDRLNKARLLRIISEHLPNFPDRGVDAVVGVEKYIFPPDSFDDLLPRNQLSSLLDQQQQQLHWNPLQLKQTARSPELIAVRVELKIVSESDWFRNTGWLERHESLTPRWTLFYNDSAITQQP